MKLFRAVSRAERNDYNDIKTFRTSKNTLEAKQFFISEIAVNEFIRSSKSQKYSPPYKYLFSLDIDEHCLSLIPYDEQELDRFTAITIFEKDLPQFNKCISFVHENAV